MDRLIVAMNDIEVARLTRAADGALTLAYTKEWISRPGARPLSLSLPLAASEYKGSEVPRWLSSLVPPSPTLREQIASRRGLADSSPFSLLAACGTDCLGAVRFLNNSAHMNCRTSSTVPLSSADCAAIAKGKLPAIVSYALLGGERPETAVCGAPGNWQAPTNGTPSTWLMHSGPHIEAAWLGCALMHALQIPTQETRLLKASGAPILAVKRFDRRPSQDGTWTMRLPAESMATAVSGDGGLGDMLRTLLAARNPVEDRLALLRSAIVSWLLADGTFCANRIGLLIAPGGSFALAPLPIPTPMYADFSRSPSIEKEVPFPCVPDSAGWSKTTWTQLAAEAHKGGFSDHAIAAQAQKIRAEIDGRIDSVADSLPHGFPYRIIGPVLEGVRRQARALPK